MFETQLIIPGHLSSEVSIGQCRSLIRFIVSVVAHLASVEHLSLCLSSYSRLTTMHVESTVLGAFIQGWGLDFGP